MKIGIDGNEVIHGERAIRRYALNFVRSLSSVTGPEEFKILYFKFRKPAYEIPLSHSSNVKNQIVPFPGKLIHWTWEHWQQPSLKILLGPKVDLFHALGGMVPPRSSTPIVLTVHSVAHLRIPEYIDSAYRNSYEAFMKKSVKKADHFICVSDSMRQDFMAHYGVSSERVRVIPLGIGKEFYPRPLSHAHEYLKKRFGLEDPYLLYVGGIQANKNIQGILETFSVLKKQKEHSRLKLVLAGSAPSYADNLFSLIPKMNLTQDILTTGYLEQDTEDLPMLYSAAKAFFFPSFWEGWSSPPLEAMACGAPVVASDIPPHRENLAQSALLVNPNEVDQMVEGLNKILLNREEDLLEIKKSSREWAKQFTWERMTQSTLEYYHQILSTRNYAQA